MLRTNRKDSVRTTHLEPLKSSEIIIDHVKEGIELAKKYKLPSAIIDFIQTHHGTSVAYYFYKKFLDKNPKGTDMERNFAYAGPKPFSKETAIVMMADAVEAASRSLQNYSEENISELVERIIYIQEQDGQFSETPLTFKDITDIKSVFTKRLSNIYHARIAYPERDAQEVNAYQLLQSLYTYRPEKQTTNPSGFCFRSYSLTSRVTVTPFLYLYSRLFRSRDGFPIVSLILIWSLLISSGYRSIR